MVFLALRRKAPQIHYCISPAGYEVDFYLPESGQLIQVAQNMDQPATREREVRALADGLRGLGLSHGLILTDANAAPHEQDGLSIEIRSVVEWLLSHEGITL
jgi:uncharacterized protein